MRHSLFSMLFLSVFAFSTSGQNLVPNPGFETPASCPSNNIFTAASWYNPNTASPDYFHPCGTGWTVPPNVLFGPQTAHSGSSFAGAGWYGLGGGWYDYMQVQLTTPLVAGATYSVSMWVILASGVTRASDDIGIYISGTPFKSNATNLPSGFSVVPTTPAGSGVFTTLTPQIKCPDNNFITDINNWTQVSGTYVATGGEQAITIGCFEPWATTGTMTVNITGNDRCYYFIDDVSVELMGAPAVPAQPAAVNGAATLCSFSSQLYSVSPVSGATSYSWSLPSGWTGTSTTNTIAVTSNSISGLISVSAVNSAGSSSSQTLALNVHTFQAVATQVNSSLQTSVTGTYQWVDCNNNYSVMATGSNTFVPPVNGNFAVVITQNNCIDTSACIALSIYPGQAGPISGLTMLCSGASNVYSIAPVSGATSYSWNLPSGWTGSSLGNTIQVTAGTGSGTLSVIALNANGTSNPQTFFVNVTYVQASVSQLNSSLTTTNPGTLQWVDCDHSYSVVAAGNATFVPQFTGNYALVASQNGCSDTSTCFQIQLAPAQPGLVWGSGTLCAHTTQIYSITAVPGATAYTWNLPAGWTGTSVTNSIQVVSNANSGSITVSANNSAGQSPSQFLTVSVISVTAAITQSANILYSNQAGAYQWLNCDLNYSIVASSGPSYTPVVSGNYAVRITQNGCTDTSACVKVNLVTSGLAEWESSSGLIVFPNPANDKINVSVSRNGALMCTISYLNGQILFQKELVMEKGVETELNVDNLTPGIYLLRLTWPDKPTTVRKISIVK